MIIPIRCFTCGKLIADRWIEYETELQKLYITKPGLYQNINIDKKTHHVNQVLNKVNLVRPCCRTMFIGHIDMFHLI